MDPYLGMDPGSGMELAAVGIFHHLPQATASLPSPCCSPLTRKRRKKRFFHQLQPRSNPAESGQGLDSGTLRAESQPWRDKGTSSTHQRWHRATTTVCRTRESWKTSGLG